MTIHLSPRFPFGIMRGHKEWCAVIIETKIVVALVYKRYDESVQVGLGEKVLLLFQDGPDTREKKGCDGEGGEWDEDEGEVGKRRGGRRGIHVMEERPGFGRGPGLIG